MILHTNYLINAKLFYLGQVCRVEDILVSGVIKGSIVHIHRARTVIVDTVGMITASELGTYFLQLIVILNVCWTVISAFWFNAPPLYCKA